ncbi:type II toxin-antitoxin system Phd/YefM family antitoxin [Pseudomonas sp. HR96]|uniref:type II toxin-antitoxin system Phd/YefM family antitoxin n=1 Tax=Pseudomonas sp. HR96 TaxID=1027966 RepID=UPI002A75A9F6|nr:type II toxin-antitoxin system Phd/YefM family antitoxin [Pseudomonas sp. HR96]WPP00737.1 type II toxin-antitoxin system Phd/YefM family antitoxin [Pseudomonas sp. HR96]
MPHAMLARVVASITDLKRNPMGTLLSGGGDVVAILNRNEPAFYCVPADRYEAMLDYIDEMKLAEEVKARLAAGNASVKAKIVGDDIVFEGDDA